MYLILAGVSGCPKLILKIVVERSVSDDSRLAMIQMLSGDVMLWRVLQCLHDNASQPASFSTM